jgi:hypothetical protein
MSRLARPAQSPEEGGALTHSRIWDALDALAARFGMSPSGLAKRAGLDATTFNRSKRSTVDGRLRWPSTESVSKALEATGATLADFLALISGDALSLERQPAAMIRLADLSELSRLPEPKMRGLEWTHFDFFDGLGPDCFAVAIAGEGWPPLYGAGALLLVSPDAPIRAGDRMLLKPISGKVVAGTAQHKSAAEKVAIHVFDSQQTVLRLRADEVAWTARILWCSQ